MSVLATGVLASGDWASRGACHDEDPELFFPITASGPGRRQIDRAKAVCARCLVRAECLSYALGSGQESGVWGGTSEEERQALRMMGRVP